MNFFSQTFPNSDWEFNDDGNFPSNLSIFPFTRNKTSPYLSVLRFEIWKSLVKSLLPSNKEWENWEMATTLPNIKLMPNRSIRATFKSFFSEFGPFVAPPAHFDRPERSLHMRLYLLNKQSLSLVIVAFFACFLLGIFIGIGKSPALICTF